MEECKEGVKNERIMNSGVFWNEEKPLYMRKDLAKKGNDPSAKLNGIIDYLTIKLIMALQKWKVLISRRYQSIKGCSN